MKGWVGTLALVDQTIGPNERDAVLTSWSPICIAAGHQVEYAFAIRSPYRAKPVFVATERVERHIQIRGWFSVHSHVSLYGIKDWLCRRTASFR
jgi:hypothetical protein